MGNSYSLFRKGFSQKAPVASGTGDTTTNTKTVLQLNRDYLTTEHYITVTATQNYTTVPTSATMATVMSSISLTLSGSKNGGNGDHLPNVPGRAFYETSRFYEPSKPVIFSAAAGTATAAYTFDLYHAFPDAYNDLQSAIFTGEYSQILLTINWANYATAAVFSGGTMTGTTTSYAVNVVAEEMPVLYTGPDSNAALIGTVQQTMQVFNKSIGAAGNGDDVLLQTGNKVRCINILAYDNGGALSDAVLSQVYFNFAGYNYQATWNELKQANFADRGYSQTGSVFIDFGDDPTGWLDLVTLNEARLKWTASAQGTFVFTQINMRGKNS